MAQNCWEAKNCGREPGGPKVADLGECPSARLPSFFNGKNGGVAAGRYCWKIAGTLCGGKVQGTAADKLQNCLACEFYQKVKEEQGGSFEA